MPTNSSTKLSTPLRSKILFFIVVGACLCALLYARVQIYFYNEAQETLPNFIGKVGVVVGTVADDPDKRASSTHVNIVVTEINKTPASGTLLALLSPDKTVAYGDTVQVRGFIEAPQAFETNTGRVFDYPGYLRVRGVVAVMQYASLQDDKPAGMSIKGALFFVKHYFESSLERVIAAPQVSLLEGMLLGERGGFSQPLLQAFIIVGLIHIVVLSGYNRT